MNPFTKSKPDPRQQLQEVPDDARRIFNNTIALRSLVSELESPIIQRALGAECAGNEMWRADHYITGIMPTLDERHPAALAALRTLENSPEFQAAEKLIAPILAAVAALAAQEAEAATKRAEAEQAHRDALDAATAAALEKARRDPLVVKARSALASLIGG